MMKRVVFIHTVPLLVNLFNQLGASYLPGVQLFHVVNEVLIERVRINGKANSKEKEWLEAQVSNAVDIGASAVLVTCTILSGYVDEIKLEAKLPILKIDEEMVKKAVTLGYRIGIIVTNPDTIQPSSQMILDYASSINKKVILQSVLADKAFDAIRNGNGELHDKLVREKLFEIAHDVDVIVLAQASMARVLETIPEAERSVPILSSPHLALVRLKEIIES